MGKELTDKIQELDQGLKESVSAKSDPTPTYAQAGITLFALPVLGVYLGALLGASVGVGFRVYQWVVSW